MLNPDSRQLYIEALKPPANYKFDGGIATTFSLDLMTLLVAPLSLAMFECKDEKNFMTDPFAVLEALRRAAQNLTVFCQRGRISIPPRDSLLYSYLEDMVVEVTPDNDNGVFHPKVWLIRYISEFEAPMYKFLCLSRNITFDKSWDTILILEGKVSDKEIKNNETLVEFFSRLPELSFAHVNTQKKNSIKNILKELNRVEFSLPDGFSDIRFWPLGISDKEVNPLPTKGDRMLTVSPFLADQFLNTFSSINKKILVSRSESLDELEKTTLTNYDELWILDELAEEPEIKEKEEEDKETCTEIEAQQVLKGLHAKLFITEIGDTARLWTGSANATNAAFNNLNIEFLVELIGKKDVVGIDQFLGKDNKVSFQSLLKPYTILNEKPETTIEAQLNKKIENIRDLIIKFDLKANAVAKENDLYDLVLSASCKVDIKNKLTEIDGVCWPINLKKEPNAKPVIPLLVDGEIIFSSISLLALTSFIAFEISTEHQGKQRMIILKFLCTGDLPVIQ